MNALLAAPGQHRTIVVLGGGGMKGLAHIGLWAAIEERGVTVDALVGTSIGSLIATFAAAGASAEQMAIVAGALTRKDIVHMNARALLPFGIRQASLFSGAHYKAYLRRVLPASRWTDLKIPLRINAASLTTGQEIWFGAGVEQDIALHDAVYASCAIPVYFPPLLWKKHLLSDGALSHQVASDAAFEWGATRVIACDVSSPFAEVGADFLKHGLIGMHERTLAIFADRYRKLAPLAAPWGTQLTIVRPDIARFDKFDFEHTEDIIEAGYVAGSQALDEQGYGSPPSPREILNRVLSHFPRAIRRLHGTIRRVVKDESGT